VYSDDLKFGHETSEVLSLPHRFRQVSQVIALLVATLGLAVLCGWAFHVPALTYIRPTLQSMKVNTALSFLFLGAGLWLADNDERQRLRRILGLLVVVIAGATLAEYVFHVSLGMDQLVFRDTRTPSLSAYPGRMSIATAICFLLLGLAVTFLGLKKAIAVQRALVTACLAISLVALSGYLYEANSLYSITAFSTMALHTAAGIFAACLAYFLARPDEGIMSIVVSDTDSGLLLRTVVPAIIVVPILIGWVRLAGQRANLYDTAFGVALQVLGSVACLAVLTMLVARSMYRIERERRKVGEAFSKAFRNSPVLLTITSAKDHRYLEVSESFEQWTGWRRDEVIGKTPFHIDIWVNATERSEMVRQILAKGIVRNLEVRYRRKDGVELVGLASAELIKIGNEQCVISAVADISERKRAEVALLRHAAIVDSSDDAIIGTDVHGTVTDWNKGAERLFGYSATEAIAKNISVLTTDRSEEGQGNLKKVLNGDVVKPYETVLQRKDGTSVDVSLGISPIVDAEGRIVGVSEIARDVTERKLAERELSQTNERLNLTLEAGQIGGWEWDIKNGRSFWFGQTHALLGTNREIYSASTEEFRDRVHPEDRDWLRDAVQKAMRNHTDLDAEFRVVWPEGSVHWLRSQARFFYGADGEAERMLGISVDITERKLGEEALRKSEEQLRASEERLRMGQWAAHIGTFDLNLRTGVDIWTPETEALYGLPPGGFGGTLAAFENLIHPDDRERVIELTQELIRTRQPVEAEWRAVWPDGSVHWIAGQGQVLVDESGEPLRMLGVNMDITERKRAEEAVFDMTRKLVEAQEQERSRIGRELHDDVGQRLAMLSIAVGQLGDKNNVLPEVRDRMQELKQMTADISTGIRTLSHELHSSMLEYLGLAKGMKSWCEEYGERYKLEIDFKTEDVQTVPQETSLCLFRVLQEALHNAAKHSGVRRIEVQLAGKPGEIHLIVSDSGKGFYIEAGRQKRGLGLTSMQERVRLVGGTIAINSKPLAGTTVHVCVPCRAERDCQNGSEVGPDNRTSCSQYPHGR
jgi:PAS domain S-box-containing protein